MNFDETGINNQ